jgi:hypothetical protein
VGGFGSLASDGGLAVQVGFMQAGGVWKVVCRLVVDQRIMGAQLGHNSLGEGEVDGGEIVGELRSPRWRWSTGEGVSWLVFPGVALRCEHEG